MNNKRVARLLKETAQLIDLTGGNAFRSRAFSNAARTLERLDESVDELVEADRLTEVPGIGSGLANDIRQVLETGSFALRDQLLDRLPPGLLDVLRIPGLGPKKVRTLWQSLDITSLDALEHAASTGALSQIKGFSAKSQATILAEIQTLRSYAGRRRYADAVEAAAPIREQLQSAFGASNVVATGAFRRKLETVASADFLVRTSDPDARDEILFDDGFRVRVFTAPPDSFGTRLWTLTGPDEHCTALIEHLREAPEVPDEAAIYRSAGLPVIPPELRDDGYWLDRPLPDLITVSDLQGNLHNHSTYSDGANSLREMAEAARALGHPYFGICDHSQSLGVANGMSVARVAAQQEEIRALNAEFASDGGTPFRIFSGIESDILADGALDYPDDVLASFDFVVASVHTRFNMSEAEATKRILKAVSNPYTTILGHPTGRLLLKRDGYPVDHEQVIDACAEHGVSIELNANPYRLDLDWRWIRPAVERGVLISINPDAHSTDQLAYVRWGVAVARKGGLTASDCLNARSSDEFADHLNARA